MHHTWFASKLYRLQADGRLYVHEHPSSASNRIVHEMIKRMKSFIITNVVGHMCKYGMHSKDANGREPAKKPVFLSSREFANVTLQHTCLYGHRHVVLARGTARTCQSYPDSLC